MPTPPLPSPREKTFIHIGIGGSHLGAEMLINSLSQSDRCRFIFVNNIDPDALERQLRGIDFSDCLIHAVSKSGKTPETLAGLSILCQKLADAGIPPEKLRHHCVFSTDPKDGPLLSAARDWKVPCLPIPPNVGGRFSVLTSVGLLPALFAKIDCQALLAGAKQMRKTLLGEGDDNPLCQSAAAIMALKDCGINQTVLMPYSSCFQSLAPWFVQLWAESLGKKFDRKGKVVHTGLTPIPACGAIDQHSQMQLFMEGPPDKLLIIIEIAEFARDFDLPPPEGLFANSSLPLLEDFRQRRLSQLFRAELYGTLRALKEANRPYLRLVIPKHDATALGGLILLFESLTVMVGESLGIDPFDQPGVEKGKLYAQQWPSAPVT